MTRHRLDDMHLVALNAASNYAGGVMPVPRKGTDHDKFADACSYLLIRGLVERIAPVGGPATWLQPASGGGPRSSLVITTKGLLALNASPEDDMGTKTATAAADTAASTGAV